ncbi:MerR family transcriptional regulator [Ktedonobacter racemifer]|uniref:Transcriptional regulator, MerR family n=1 Tax=Ktedonobacter racemifer DSM 44963 TaxID=485913 RepID=D6TFV8_KTERA|nr:MerR family transcriptional regulator [Ktedonobacter racemifer]EFH90591.1 transcriptional regulator, MerR family [Ktedonobacter racemifer DSM 44963]
MDRQFYHTGQFARMASVSIRTLRFYDKVGLLSPSGYTEAGYRLYTDADFWRLQQILALKFLGFSLEEIKACLRVGPSGLRESLQIQHCMLMERKQQLDKVLQALEETQRLLEVNTQDWSAILHVIQVIQMQQDNEWRKKYLNDEQLQKMDELSRASYTEEQRQQIAERGKNFTEADQVEASRRWSELGAELKRLMSINADPAGPEAQALAAQWNAMIASFTQGDPGITQGLKNFYGNLGKMPEAERPIAMPYSKEEWAFINQMLAAYQQQH